MFGNDRQEREASAAAARGQVETLRARVADLEAVNEAHRKLNGELQVRVSQLEARLRAARLIIRDLEYDIKEGW